MIDISADPSDSENMFVLDPDGNLLNPSGLTVLDYLKHQRRIRSLLNPLYLGPSNDFNINTGLWIRCDDCGAVLYIRHVRENNDLCMSCGYHMKMSSSNRLEYIVDKGSWRPLFQQISSCDPLEFEDYNVYTDRALRSQKSTRLLDALQTGTAFIDNVAIAIAAMDFGYMGGSMGSVVGEKLTRLIEYAIGKGLPLLVVCSSGGARMQEGSLSLMQMAKISSALHMYQSKARLPYITLLTSPTTGGVTASFGMLGDFIVTEPKAIIGFAGRRVIEATIGEILPSNFQTAEYLQEKGQVDMMVERKHIREVISSICWASTHGLYKNYGFSRSGLINGFAQTREERGRRLWENIYPNFIADFFNVDLFPTLNGEEIFHNLKGKVTNLKIKRVLAKDPLSHHETKVLENYTNLIQANARKTDEKKEVQKKSFLYSREGFLYRNYELKEPYPTGKLFTNKININDQRDFPFGLVQELRVVSDSLPNDNPTKANDISDKTFQTFVSELAGVLGASPFYYNRNFASKRINRYIKLMGQWFEDLPSDKGYFQVLSTFQSFADILSFSLVDREKERCKSFPFYFNYDRDSKSKRFRILDEAIAFAKAQSIHWKNFSQDSLLAQKRSPFQKYSTGFQISTHIELENETRFYYFILEKHRNLLEKREAARLADPNRYANERRVRRNLYGNAKQQAENLEAEIQVNYNYVLNQKTRKPTRRK
jgi:acetyl-CoA carboxylase carboxyl transferase subunit beta